MDKPWYTGFTPILLLLVAVAIVVWRLPKVQGLPHLENSAYRRRRALNWLVAGTTYAFLYWGRYNLQPAIEALGATVALLANENTPEYEKQFVANHECGRLLTSPLEIPPLIGVVV